MTRNLEAMRQLRRVVEDAPEELFHMRAVVERTECGTARCALGWAIIDPWFRKNTALGDLYFRTYSYSYISESPHEVFGLTRKTSNLLFGGDLGAGINPHAVTRAEVLANIDRLLAGKRALRYKVLR